MTIFARVLAACILPLIVVFAVILISINGVVYDQVASFADDKAKNFSTETAMQINERFVHVRELITVVEVFLNKIDPSAPDAETNVSEWILSMLNATPYIHCIWLSYEAGEFLKDERFTRDYLKLTDDSSAVLYDVDGDKFDNDPESIPWYYVPLSKGDTWFEVADYYDYGHGLGSKFMGTVSKPLKRDGKIVGVVGVDMFYDKTFRFIDSRQRPHEQLVLIISQNGQVVYSPDSALIAKSIFDMDFDWRDAARERLAKKTLQEEGLIGRGGRPLVKNEYVRKRLSQDKSFSIDATSPFHGTLSKIYFHPVTEADSKNEQLYLYVDMPYAALFEEAVLTMRNIIATCVACLIVLTLALFFMMRAILKPIKKLTESAGKIASGDLDSDSAFTNITSAGLGKKSKNEINMLFSALRDMQESLSQTNLVKAKAAAKTDFLARMSHEIRTPMNAITGMAELALREDMAPAAQEHVHTIKQASASLLSLINDILDLSKIESGKLEIVPNDYELSSLVNDVVCIIRMKVVNSKVRFVVNIDSRLPNKLRGDEVRLRQVLLNILSNAVKYTDSGFISLDISGRMIGDDSVEFTFEIKDSGRGIKEDDVTKLFGEFVQVNMAENRDVEGTGLGLAITKNLVKAMGGEISVSSVYGKGSTFTVIIPQLIRSRDPFAAVERAWEKKVLLYERRQIFAESMRDTLDDLGVVCVCVRSDDELRAALKEGWFTYLFVNSFLLESAKKALAECGSGAEVVLLSSFGDAVAVKGLSVISMPAHAVSIANILNGVIDKFTVGTDSNKMVRYNAPDARVLVVDDIATNLKVAEGLLAPYRVKVDSVLSGSQAIDAVKKNQYDIIFMDHMMPGMGGIETVQILREMDVNGSGRVPIVALTANALSGAKEMFLKNKFNDFISKPIDIAKLNACLDRWIPAEKRVPAAASNDSDDPFEVGQPTDGVDVKLGLSRNGGTIAAYLATLGMFAKEGRKKIEEIKEALDAEDLKGYTILVHGLKSAAASIGATNLSEAAMSLEMAAREGDKSYIENNSASLIAELDRILLWVEETVTAHKQKHPKTDIDKNVLKTVLADLQKALDDLDPAAIKSAVKIMREYENSPDVGDEISEILHDVLNGDYDEASARIEKLSAR